jgi:hypothetical protein
MTGATARMVNGVSHANAAIWVETYLKTENGLPFTFRDHVYQIEPLLIDHPRISIRKATQRGWTLLMMCKLLYAMTHGRVPVGAITLFPSDVSVGNFSQTRWTPLLQENAYHLARFVKSTNNIHNRRVCKANLMFRGGKMTQRIGGVMDESSALRSDPADVLIEDEKDLIPPAATAEALKRLDHSLLKWHWDLSNPTIPNYGIDTAFLEGDQRYWMCRCEGCNQWWAPDIEFPGICRRDPAGKVHLACLKCEKPLNVNSGQWVAKLPDRSKDHVSYHDSHVCSTRTDLSRLLKDYESPPDGNLSNVMRFDLGLPYLDASLGFSSSQVLLCCDRNRPMALSSRIRTAFGVDVGKQLHCVVGYRQADDSYHVLALILAKNWAELAAAMQAYSCEVASIDNEPELHEAREFQRRQRSREIWLSDYGVATGPAAYDHASRIVRVNRNEILDHTHYLIVTAGKLLLPAVCAMVEDFAAQCANDVKVVNKKPGTGDAIVSYIERGPDHWRHAFANFVLAARRQTPKMEASMAGRVSSPDWDLYARKH